MWRLAYARERGLTRVWRAAVLYEDGDRSPALKAERVRPRRRSSQQFTLLVLPSGLLSASLNNEELVGQLRSHTVTTHHQLRVNQWAHVACVVGHGLLEVYVNGIREARKEVETHCRGPRLFVGGCPTVAGPAATVAHFDVYTDYLDAHAVWQDMGGTKNVSPDRVCRITHVTNNIAPAPAVADASATAQATTPSSRSRALPVSADLSMRGLVCGCAGCVGLSLCVLPRQAPVTMASLLEEFPTAHHLIALGLSFSFATYREALRTNNGDVVAAADWLMSRAANGEDGSPDDGQALPAVRHLHDAGEEDGSDSPADGAQTWLGLTEGLGDASDLVVRGTPVVLTSENLATTVQQLYTNMNSRRHGRSTGETDGDGSDRAHRDDVEPVSQAPRTTDTATAVAPSAAAAAAAPSVGSPALATEPSAAGSRDASSSTGSPAHAARPGSLPATAEVAPSDATAGIVGPFAPPPLPDEVRKKASLFQAAALRHMAVAALVARAPDSSSAARSRGVSGRRANAVLRRGRSELARLLRRGSLVYADLYMHRVPVEIRREMRSQQLYKVQVLAIPETGSLGGVRAMVKMSNLYVRCQNGQYMSVTRSVDAPILEVRPSLLLASCVCVGMFVPVLVQLLFGLDRCIRLPVS